MDLKTKILLAIRYKALFHADLLLAVEVQESELSKALYELTQEYLVNKHPVVTGCKNCACMQTFVWRLTLKGRQHLEEQAL